MIKNLGSLISLQITLSHLYIQPIEANLKKIRFFYAGFYSIPAWEVSYYDKLRVSTWIGKKGSLTVWSPFF